MLLKKDDFINKLLDMGFVYQEPVVRGGEVYSISTGNYLIQASVYYESVIVEIGYNDIRVVNTEQLVFSDDTINIINRLLIAYDDNHRYTITFDNKDMIKEAEFCGYKINEEQAKNLIEYLNRKDDGVYETIQQYITDGVCETIQQYITGYCQNHKFEELKEEE